MKKVVKFFIPFLIASSAIFSGCKKNEKQDDRILLSFGDVHSQGTTAIGVDKLNELVNDKDSFLLVVASTTCGCWTEFRPNLESYLVENKAICYQIDYEQIKDVGSAYDLFHLSSSTTTFAIFEDGKVQKTLCTSDDSGTMYDQSKFFAYMEKVVKLPSCYFITKDDFHTIKDSGKNAVIYFERTACGDCTYLNPRILRSYIKNHPNMNKIYVIDCQPYYRKKDAADYQTYLDVKDELGLSTVNNPTYGYGAGVFPFFSYIENKQYASGAVIYNDSVDSNMVVAKSYYTEEMVASLEYTNTVVQGKQLTSDDVNIRGTYVSWKHEAADSVYEGILNSFLDYALPKTTFTF